MTAPTGRCLAQPYIPHHERGDRIVECSLPACHDGEHRELIDGEIANAWAQGPEDREPAPMPSDPADLINTILAASRWSYDVAENTPPPAFVRADTATLMRLVAARQAAATLRWLADNLDAKANRVNATTVNVRRIRDDLRELADQLDTQETP